MFFDVDDIREHFFTIIARYHSKLMKKQIIIRMVVIHGDPFFDGIDRKLFHQYIPMVEIGIQLTIWISFHMSKIILLIDSRYMNIFPSADPGRLVLLRYDYLLRRVSI